MSVDFFEDVSAAALMPGSSFPPDSTNPATSLSPSVDTLVCRYTSVNGLGFNFLSLVGVRTAGLASKVSGPGDDGICR